MFRTLPSGRTNQTRLGIAIGVLVGLVAAALASPSASVADDDSHLHHRQSRLDDRIDVQRTDVDEISGQLMRAQSRVDAAVGDLAAARALLADLEVQVRRAELRDARTQERLDRAVVRLHNARADVRRGQRDLATQRSLLAGYAVSGYQTGQGGIVSLGLGFDAETARDAVDGMQDADSILNKQMVALQQMQAGEVLLSLTEDRVEDTLLDVQAERVAAADDLARSRALERRATRAKRDVAARVDGLRAERRQVAEAKRDELARLRELESERSQVESRLRAIAERRAEQHHTTLADSSAPPKSVSGATLIYPVNDTYVTSPYGMRMHPILHIYELHDGTDFHADCGTPVYAAAAGTVTEEYFNTGYGNRVIIDHGYVRGVSLWTSYNHLTSFVASVGEHVDQGQLVAYSGTTGYSTACHLHFMVYVNGATVDPMGWL